MSRGTPPGRKPVFEDMRVIAALEVLKAAVLAVNGDKEVISEIVLLDVRMQDGSKGMAALHMHICNCPGCIGRFSSILHDEFAIAFSQGPERRAVH